MTLSQTYTPDTATAALSAVTRGFKIFRLRPGTKAGFVDRDWALNPIGDICTAFDAFTGEHSSDNYGIHVGASGLVVADIDLRGANAGKTWQAVAAEHKLPSTHTVQTPSGGVHLYYKAKKGVRYSQRAIAPNIDVRAGNGYVVGPGSVIDGRPYVTLHDVPMAEPPEGVDAQTQEIETVNNATPDDYPRAEVAKALAHIPPADDRDNWLRVGMMLHAGSGGGDAAFQQWGLWSSQSDKYNGEDQERVWASFDASRERRLDLGSLFRLASAHGYKKPAPTGDELADGFAGIEASEDSRPRQQWADATSEAVDIDWLVEDLIPVGGTGALVGASGAGKTFLAIHLAKCVENGHPFFGREISKRGGTYIVAAEGAYSLKARITAADRGGFAEIADTIEGKSKGCPMRWSVENPDLLSPNGLKAFLVDLAETNELMLRDYGVPLRLVIIDTLNQAFDIEDENHANEMRRVTRAMQIVAKRTGAAVLSTHHFGKDETKGARGSNALRGNVDLMLYALKGGKLHIHKMRDAQEGPLGSYEMPTMKLGLKRNGKIITSRYIVATVATAEGAPLTEAATATEVPKPKRLDAEFMAAFKAAAVDAIDGARASIDAVRQEYYSRKEGNPEAKRKAFRRALSYATEQAGFRKVDGHIIDPRGHGTPGTNVPL